MAGDDLAGDILNDTTDSDDALGREWWTCVRGVG